MAHPRTFIADLGAAVGDEVVLAGWVHALRTTKSTTFLVVHDASGNVQVVAVGWRSAIAQTCRPGGATSELVNISPLRTEFGYIVPSELT
jgi:aspartyl/asparaginyl-tRNA synthetase